jgi:hypothetical protein
VHGLGLNVHQFPNISPDFITNLASHLLNAINHSLVYGDIVGEAERAIIAILFYILLALLLG